MASWFSASASAPARGTLVGYGWRVGGEGCCGVVTGGAGGSLGEGRMGRKKDGWVR
eukprot:COSAG02_NODE_213_length_28704_cov_69.390177_21_plen_56_part_00